MNTQSPPHQLFGIDVDWAASMLLAVMVVAILFAIYTALTVRDPMAKRVKALSERREELKAGITASSGPKKRAKLVRRSETTDSIRQFLDKLKVLQDSQLAVAQQSLAQAGIRNKEWAVAVILGRMVMPIVLGLIAATMLYWTDMYPTLSSFKRFMFFAAAVGLGYKGPDIYLQNLTTKRTNLIRKGLPDALLIVDPKKEQNAVLEAKRLGIPVIGIGSTDTDVTDVSYPILANDASRASIAFIVKFLADAYKNQG